jgi:hypothetical protein
MGHSWTIDLDAVPTLTPTPTPQLPPGSVLVADVCSFLEPRGPRMLVAFRDGTSVAVRKPDGELIWLDTPSMYALVGRDGVEIEVVAPDEEGLIPRHCGDEAIAMLSLDDVLDWAAARPVSPVQAERVQLKSPDSGDLVATIDPVVPVVRRLERAGSSDDPLLTTEQFGFLPRNERWFAPSHIVMGPWPHDAEGHR